MDQGSDWLGGADGVHRALGGAEALPWGPGILHTPLRGRSWERLKEKKKYQADVMPSSISDDKESSLGCPVWKRIYRIATENS